MPLAGWLADEGKPSVITVGPLVYGEICLRRMGRVPSDAKEYCKKTVDLRLSGHNCPYPTVLKSPCCLL